jgi:GTP-binding protein EngB required for normal cell division
MSQPRPSNSEIQPAQVAERQQRQARNPIPRLATNRFRVLVIGRANAGKTTILQRVCNTTEKPKIFDPKGYEVFLVIDIT